MLKKPRHNFSVLPLPFCKPNKKLFLNMADINMVKNVKANCDLVNGSMEASLQTKKKMDTNQETLYNFE